MGSGHSWRYTRTMFSQDEFDEFLQLAERLAQQLENIAVVDGAMEEIVWGDIELL